MALQAIEQDLGRFLKSAVHVPVPATVKTKIICTIGPATQSVEMLKKLLVAGMSTARLNFSHGTHEYHKTTINNVRQAVRETGIQCAIMLDTKGPEIRTGLITPNEKGVKEIVVEAGQIIEFISDPQFPSYRGDGKRLATSYENLPKVLRPGNKILVDDGLVTFTVLEVKEDSVVARAENAGVIGETKGVNLPNVKVDLPPVTEQDKRDIAFGVEQGVDSIAASFIRNAQNIVAIRELPGVKAHNIKIIAKIESQEGLDDFENILEASDAIMVARGDLGVEIPLEKVSIAQKMMIMKCNVAGKPVITATQMLESMTNNPRPTRAETTDVANAVFDGTDCVMLSGETARGKFPVETVTMMVRICQQAEAVIDYRELYKQRRKYVVPPIPVPEAVASSAVKTAWDITAKLIIVLTETGNTARLVSKYRPHSPILCVTHDDTVARQLLMTRGAVPHLQTTMNDEHLVLRAMAYAKQSHLAATGDLVVVTSGFIQGVSGSTNMLRVLTVPEDLNIPE